MNKSIIPFAGLAGILCAPLVASGLVIVPNPPGPLPPPIIRPITPRADDKPIAVTKTESIVSENDFFQRRKADFVFTNPNARVMQGEFEFPIPDGAFVCGYALEINGEMVPGVVCEKEKARVAFENEVRKGVDPGLVEQVKGNLWRTRISPLNPNAPRRAEVEYVVPKSLDTESSAKVVYERDGDDVFVARMTDAATSAPSGREAIAAFTKGTILWDASLSRLGAVEADRAALATLPEKGEWTLIVFSNTSEKPQAFTTRDALLTAIDKVVYDGGTDLAAALATTARGSSVLLFTDEVDTLSEKPIDLEGDRSLILASRPPAPARAVSVVKLTADEAASVKEAKASSLLATVWASRRMNDLSSQAEARKDEFLALGRRYGVAGPGLSLIVLETLQQWLDNKIEPPAALAIHAEWLKRRAAEDDPIAAKKAQADHEAQLLRYWEERVKWWNDPKPPKKTPKSGLFDNAVRRSVESGAPAPVEMADAEMAMESMPAPAGRRSMASTPMMMSEKKAKTPGAAGSGMAPSVTLKPWDPKTPYLEALKAAPKDQAYAVYLKQRDTYKDSPAFYLDCAGFFFAAREMETALRVISNLAEFKLENVALWRTMGWRLREAASATNDPRVADLAVRAFRKAFALRAEEGQSRRDLALVLAERGKRTANAQDLAEALRLFHEAAFVNHRRRASRRTNDFQVSVIALEELNGLLAWCAANRENVGDVQVPAIDAAYRRDLPVKLRIVLSWDADETDIDLHVLEPNGEEAFYGHRRTSEGGFVSEDVTTGYGPEEYLKKDLETGVYRVLTNYFASHQTTLTGATTVQATVYTDWATKDEKMQILTLRLDKPKSKVTIGEIKL